MSEYVLLVIVAIAVSRAAFGQGTGPVFLSSVRCTGNESFLLNCSHSGSVQYCSHFYDAGVVCPPCKSHLCHSRTKFVKYLHFQLDLQNLGTEEVYCS